MVKNFCSVFGDIAQFNCDVIVHHTQKLSFLKMI